MQDELWQSQRRGGGCVDSRGEGLGFADPVGGL